MTTTWLDMFETKKFWYAALTFIAFITSWFGLNLPIAAVLASMAPFAIALGAQGWADSGPAGAVDARIKAARRAAKLPDGHGAKPALMKIAMGGMLFVFVAAGCTVGCGVTSKQIEQNGFACAGKQVSASLLEQVAVDLFSKNFADLEALAVPNGLAFVNCLVTTTVATHATPPETGSGSAVRLAAPSPIVVNGNEWLSTHPTPSASGGAQ